MVIENKLFKTYFYFRIDVVQVDKIKRKTLGDDDNFYGEKFRPL